MLQELLSPLLDLLYPKLCLACGVHTPPNEALLCITCYYELPETRQLEQVENAFTEVFWGRVPITTGAALYYFTKSGRVQRLIHHLKYKHQPQIGEQLGLYYGRQLKKQQHFQGIDAVVPVPLHPTKEQLRGYNQAEAIGRGVALGMDLPLWPYALKRVEHTVSQTHKSRQARLENVQRVFQLGQAERLCHQHVLLVDDVLTTGATLETCATLINSVEGAQVSLATLAMAKD